MADDVVRVLPEAWLATVADAFEGRHLDWLGVVDELGRSDELRIVVRLIDPETADGTRLETLVPRDAPVLDSLVTVAPGISWHEREASDMFGVRFTGGDARPLLVPAHGQPGALHEWPLRKDAVLAARVAVPWPGAAQDGDTTRRRMPPAGVPAPEAFGARPADAGPRDPAELLAPPRRRR